MPHLRLAVRKKGSLLVSRPTPPPLLAPPPLAEGTLLIAYETMLGVLFKKVVKHLERERERERDLAWNHSRRNSETRRVIFVGTKVSLLLHKKSLFFFSFAIYRFAFGFMKDPEKGWKFFIELESSLDETFSRFDPRIWRILLCILWGVIWN